MKNVYMRPGCWHENILVTRKTARGRIHRRLVTEMQIKWQRVERIKDLCMHPWLLEKNSFGTQRINKIFRGYITSNINIIKGGVLY